MVAAQEVLAQLEATLVALQQNAWQQRQALIALRVGAVEALVAQQQILLQQLETLQQQCGELMGCIEQEPPLRQRWERIRLQAREVQHLLQLNRLLAQRAHEHTAALWEVLAPDGHLYDRQA